jgi:beta-glucanase (GH16 family)
MISTEKSYNALYGYYEARVRLPKGKGLWPAIWMIPSHGNSHLPEIDVLEVLGHETNVLYQYAHPVGGDKKVAYLGGGPVHSKVIDAADNFHIYGLEWSKDYIAWFIDGKETQRVKNFAFEPHYYIINLAVGGHWPGNPDASTRFPSSVDIDYVRIYSKR